MKLNRYELKSGRDLKTFEFLSEGPKGKITKVVQFEPMNYSGLYNLSFGDINEVTGFVDDEVISDNGDLEKVLATVVAAVYTFADAYPDSWVYATGSSASRTRLYRMGISRYFAVVSTDFDIMGEYHSEWEWFEIGRNYQAFAVRRKPFNLEE